MECIQLNVDFLLKNKCIYEDHLIRNTICLKVFNWKTPSCLATCTHILSLLLNYYFLFVYGI